MSDDAIQVFDGSGQTDLQKRMQKLREARKLTIEAVNREQKLKITRGGKDIPHRFFRTIRPKKYVGFFWTTERNEAGYFVGWQQTITTKWKEKKLIKSFSDKTHFFARKRRKSVRDICLKKLRKINDRIAAAEAARVKKLAAKLAKSASKSD